MLLSVMNTSHRTKDGDFQNENKKPTSFQYVQDIPKAGKNDASENISQVSSSQYSNLTFLSGDAKTILWHEQNIRERQDYVEEDSDIEETTGQSERITILSDRCLTPAFTSNNHIKNCLSIKRSKPASTTICVQLCNYELVNNIATKLGFKIVDHSCEWDIFWSSPVINQGKLLQLRGFQRTNHFPFIGELCRKNLLAKNLNNMKQLFPEEYNFFPKTWILPEDKCQILSYLNKKKTTVIVKPANESCGSGIFLARNPRHLVQAKQNDICQAYIANPFLIDGYKFDIRVYTLLTSCDPMRLYAYNNGLARFATVKYEKPNESNINNHFMHLTNYSINKNSTTYMHDKEYGSKRDISKLNEWFKRNGYETQEIWARIDDVIVKTVLASNDKLKEKYRATFSKHNDTTACFQLLGFDILLDENLNPIVLEVNSSPSFKTDTELDTEVKERVLTDTFILCNLNRSIKQKVKLEEKVEIENRLLKRTVPKKLSYKPKQWSWEQEHKGNYRLLYPCPDVEKYTLLTCHRSDKPPYHYHYDTLSRSIRAMFVKTHQYCSNMENNGRKMKKRGNKRLAVKREIKSEPKMTVKPDERSKPECRLPNQNMHQKKKCQLWKCTSSWVIF
uniref:Tubulin polyglutamylase TTLL13P n=1 Tax=Cacopsylla melanoneura TaxID=428564 RepID=A0A8D8R7R3_9HEMI